MSPGQAIDILRLKHRLGITSSDLVLRYTVLRNGAERIAGVKLRPVENGTACQYMTPDGCSVYDDRPTACRYYPVALLSMRKQDEYTDTQAYAPVKEEHCLGHNEPREISIDAYRQEQGLAEYDELARGWRQLILKKKSSGPSVGKPSKRSLQLYFMVCYDLDTFRSFVASEGFAELYDLPTEETNDLLMDDTALMLFGFRFLRQVLFGEASISLKQEVAEKRKDRANGKMQQIEREAREMRLAEQDGMYEDTVG